MKGNAEEIDALSAPEAKDFFTNYVQANRPLVIRGGATSWRAFSEWSADRLSEKYGDEIVKVAPLEVNGEHAHLDKWLESADLWEHKEEEYCCDPNKVLVVSALRVKMRLRTFFKRLKAPDEHSFYADGAGNLDHSFPFLRGDFSPPAFAAKLQLKRADLWLGGKSISRMHYDNLDNVFAQIVGSKTFVLSPPDSGAAFQGGKRLRKAARLYTNPGSFTRQGGGVLHETVLNYCAMERSQMDGLPTTTVTLHPGDMLCKSRRKQSTYTHNALLTSCLRLPRPRPTRHLCSTVRYPAHSLRSMCTCFLI